MNYHMKWAFESQIGIHMYSFYESNHHDIFLVGSHELLLRIEPLTVLCTHEINNANRYEMVAPCFLGTQKTIRCSPSIVEYQVPNVLPWQRFYMKHLCQVNDVHVYTGSIILYCVFLDTGSFSFVHESVSLVANQWNCIRVNA